MFISGITSALPLKKNTCMVVWAGLKDRQVDAAHTGILYLQLVPFFFFYSTRSDVNTGRSRRKEAGNNSSFITSLTTLLTFSQLHAAFHVVPKYQIFLHFSFLKAKLRLFQTFKTCPFVLGRNSSIGKMIMFVTFFSARLTDMSWVTASQLVWDAGRGESYCGDRQQK